MRQRNKKTIQTMKTLRTITPRTRFCDRSFAVWNCLPAALRAVEDYERFKKLLKHICLIWLRGSVTFCF